MTDQTGPVDVDAPTPPTDLILLLRRAIADPGQFCRRERWPHPDGDWAYEPVSAWSARAVEAALDQKLAAVATAIQQLTPDGRRRVLHPEHADQSWNRRGTERP